MDFNEATNVSGSFFEKLRDFDILGLIGNIFEFIFGLFSFNSEYADIWRTVKFVIALLCVFFLFVIAYSFIKIREVRKREHEFLHHEIQGYAEKHRENKEENTSESVLTNSQWQVVLNHLFSESPSDWKLAIIEADLMLENLLNQLGFKGESLGEKLKSADQESFKKLTSAWEVHTIRNKIAHEGASFPISKREASRVIAIYEDIFSQYGFI